MCAVCMQARWQAAGSARAAGVRQQAGGSGVAAVNPTGSVVTVRGSSGGVQCAACSAELSRARTHQELCVCGSVVTVCAGVVGPRRYGMQAGSGGGGVQAGSVQRTWWCAAVSRWCAGGRWLGVGCRQVWQWWRCGAVSNCGVVCGQCPTVWWCAVNPVCGGGGVPQVACGVVPNVNCVW